MTDGGLNVCECLSDATGGVAVGWLKGRGFERERGRWSGVERREEEGESEEQGKGSGDGGRRGRRRMS